MEKKITFGISQLKSEVPWVIGWIVGGTSVIMTALNLANKTWPGIFTDHIVVNVSGAISILGILAPMFGVKKKEPETTAPTENK